MDKAHRIVETGQLVDGRHAESHDVLSTCRMCSNVAEMQLIPHLAGRLQTVPGPGLERAARLGPVRAVLISEVHPFDDDNGRFARLMMNAELVSADQSRIIVTTHA